MRLAAIAVLTLWASGSLAQSPADWPRCEVTGGAYPANGAGSTVAQMRMRSGNSCSVIQNDRRFHPELAQSPTNGTATTSGNRTTYTPRPGFVGTDTFVVRDVLTAGGQMRPSFMTVNVEVR